MSLLSRVLLLKAPDVGLLLASGIATGLWEFTLRMFFLLRLIARKEDLAASVLEDLDTLQMIEAKTEGVDLAGMKEMVEELTVVRQEELVLCVNTNGEFLNKRLCSCSMWRQEIADRIMLSHRHNNR